MRKWMWSAAACVVAAGLCAGASAGSDPWADAVVDFNAGVGGTPGYTNYLSVLGSPERITGKAFGLTLPVTPFNPPFQDDEIVSIGAGGSLTVYFNEPIVNNPSNPFGVDLLIFGNSFFQDSPSFDGTVNGIFADGPFTVSVSIDGDTFHPIAGDFIEALFPTLAYQDLNGPYDSEPGSVLTDYTRPVNPALQMSDLMGKSFAELVALYDGSGGGIPVDIASSGLAFAHYVRISVPNGATAAEFDAFAAVPEPGTALPLALFGLAAAFRRKQ